MSIIKKEPKLIQLYHQSLAIKIQNDEQLTRINSTMGSWDEESLYRLRNQQYANFYDNYNDNDWFCFVKRYILLLEIQIRAKHILMLPFPIYLIHLIAQFSMARIYPLFIMPNCYSQVWLGSQCKQFVLNNCIYKFELFICDKNCDILKHKLSFYPNKGLFYCCNYEKNNNKYQISSSLTHQINPIIQKSDDASLKIYVSLTLQYKPKYIIISINLHNINKSVKNNTKQCICYTIDNA